jgi:hypothetical protein
MHLVKGHHCCPNFLPSMIRNVSLVNGQTDRLALPYYKQYYCVSLELWERCRASLPAVLLSIESGGSILCLLCCRKKSIISVRVKLVGIGVGRVS